MGGDGERVFKAAMQVFREYLIDCDADIEGCDAAELLDIEHSMAACRQLRERFVNLVTRPNDCDGRGCLRDTPTPTSPTTKE